MNFQNMDEHPHFRKTYTLDDYSAQIATWTQIGTVMAAISLISGTTADRNDRLFIEATHTAATVNMDVQAGDRIGAYDVLFVYHGLRYNTVWLRLTEGIEGSVTGHENPAGT